MRYRALAASLSVLLAAACLGTTEPEERVIIGKPVLFIGNSLTYFNDMPFMIAAFAEADGQEKLGIGSMLVGGYSLEDHWYDGRARREILSLEWDIVVMQQGPSSTPENQAHLAQWSARFTDDIRSVGARPALYMVWPEAERPEAFDAVSDSYRNAAEEVDGLLFPVGEAWRAAWRMDPDAPLYGADGFHPSVEGSYLAALVMYQQIYERSPIGLPYDLELPIGPVRIDSTLARVLQEAASEANAQFARN